jgi:hypothetical protein
MATDFNLLGVLNDACRRRLAVVIVVFHFLPKMRASLN